MIKRKILIYIKKAPRLVFYGKERDVEKFSHTHPVEPKATAPKNLVEVPEAAPRVIPPKKPVLKVYFVSQYCNIFLYFKFVLRRQDSPPLRRSTAATRPTRRLNSFQLIDTPLVNFASIPRYKSIMILIYYLYILIVNLGTFIFDQEASDNE